MPRGKELGLSPPRQKFRDFLPILRDACNKAMDLMPECGLEDWRGWHVKDELPKGFWQQSLAHVRGPSEKPSRRLRTFRLTAESMIVDRLIVEHTMEVGPIRDQRELP